MSVSIGSWAKGLVRGLNKPLRIKSVDLREKLVPSVER